MSETPEIKNLSDHSDQRDNHESGNQSGSESDDGSESKISNTTTTNHLVDVVTNAASNKAEQQTESEQSKQLSNNCTQCTVHGIDKNLQWSKFLHCSKNRNRSTKIPSKHVDNLTSQFTK